MKRKFSLTSTQIIALGFFLVILIGTFLLCLPISTNDMVSTPFIDCLFTATSATCVTGLSVVDTFGHWSAFGQVVILFLIQIGGMGFMTFIAVFVIFTKKQISLYERKILMQSAGTMRLDGIQHLVKRIFFGTFATETAGALLLATRFIPKMGFGKGLWYSVFHSVSAFCNAGFDLMSQFGSASFAGFYNDVVVNLTLCGLIIFGGIGFLVWSDINKHGFRFRDYELHSKIVLSTTFVLIFGGAVLIFITEYNGAFADYNFGEKILCSLFQSVTTRTAGFYTVPQSDLSNPGIIVSTILMFIGGSPGSTAGGIKTTTIAVIFMNIIAFARNKDSINMFKRRIYDRTVKYACAILSIYVTFIIIATTVISALEPFALRDIIFEVVSAIATVGLSTGITSSFCLGTKIVLIVLMYAGRLGGLSLIIAFAEKRDYTPIERPYEKILIG